MANLYVNAWLNGSKYYFDIGTLITVYLYNLSKTDGIKLKIRLLSEKPRNVVWVTLDLIDIYFEIVQDVPELTTLCTWPVILKEKYLISGLCSVARQIVKYSSNENFKKLLGFREACLVSCAEVSVWTKFCEVDIINTVQNILNGSCFYQDTFNIPEQLAQYEVHLSTPVKMHNIYKIARDTQNNQSLQSSKDRVGVNINHDFAEGPYILLSDLILYPCFQIIFDYFEKKVLTASVKSKIPLTDSWFNRVIEAGFPKLKFSFLTEILDSCYFSIMLPDVGNVSLYRADNTKVYNGKHTKQCKIDDALNLLKNLSGQIQNDVFPYGSDVDFNWDEIPLEVNPKGGSLPNSRAGRKCEQLENLTKAVIKLVGNKICNIVDFCSGSGHLGLLIAFLLPNCQIILVENKERSLARAQETILKLNLPNVIIAQTNLDYFVGDFDVGVALHACGVATDLVLQMCIKKKANFVCCPCCYGGVKDCHEVNYPRSNLYAKQFCLNKNKYFDLAHAADQTHAVDNAKTKQGYLCMDIIDTDRKLFAEEMFYSVYLGKLQPTSCTNKNNLLVGIYS